MNIPSHLIAIENLSISFGKKEIKHVLKDVSFTIPEGKIIGLVGESGSGKSITSLAIMGLLPKKNITVSGTITYKDKSLLELPEKEKRLLRGNEISMIFQEPMTALNPSMKCGKQVAEVLQLKQKLSYSEAKKETISLFERVKLPNPKTIYNSYPHQISGGQMQRVMIAMAISCKPQLLIADEPTTALDVTVQKEIIELLKELQKETHMGMLFISHDLALVSELADEVIVMYRGKVVEKGCVPTIFKNPKEPYTQALLASRPKLDKRLSTLPTIESLANNSFIEKEVTAPERALKHKSIYSKPPLLEVKNLGKWYFRRSSVFAKRESIKAVNGVSFAIYEGETVGLVGESGCGKSTLGKTIMQLEKATSGHIFYKGRDLVQLSAQEIRKLRKDIQLIFQDPYSSLHPRATIGATIVEPMKIHGIGMNKKQRKQKTLELLQRVGLDETYFSRYPHELSGGQRQRVGIARAIALKPKLVICDESVSALDISVQAQVLNLLNELKEDFKFTYIFISHDLAVVKYMADQLLVMQSGIIEEQGDADEVYANPISKYTQRLINSIPKGI